MQLLDQQQQWQQQANFGTTSTRCWEKRRILDHRCAGFFPHTLGFPALCHRHPPTSIETSTNHLYPSHTYITVQLLLHPIPQAYDVETKSGPAPPRGVFMKSTTAKDTTCGACEKSIHQSLNALTRMVQKKWRQANDNQCHNCRRVSNSQILCCKCGKMLPSQPLQGNLRSLRCHSASRMHSPEPRRERTS